MTDVMLDLETLGTSPGCKVVSIGAVVFDPTRDVLGDTCYLTLSRGDQDRFGLVEDPATLAWWGRQSTEARVALEESTAHGHPLHFDLGYFMGWLARQDELRNIRVWGNGSDFDQPILTRLYQVVGQSVPWRFYHNRCFRTLKSLYDVEAPERKGTHHNALDDAVFQAQWALKIAREHNVVIK